MTRRFRPGLRRWLHGGLLLIGAELFFIFLSSSNADYTAIDKQLHFDAGRSAAVLTYFLATAIVFGRILGVHTHRKFHHELRRIPFITTLTLGGGYLLSFALALGKELLDSFGFGGVESLDVLATLNGTVSLLPPTIAMIVLSFLLVPLDRVAVRLSIDTGGFGY